MNTNIRLVPSLKPLPTAGRQYPKPNPLNTLIALARLHDVGRLRGLLLALPGVRLSRLGRTLW